MGLGYCSALSWGWTLPLPSATMNGNEPIVACFVCHSWLVWKRGLATSPRLSMGDQLTRWGALGVFPRNFMGTFSRRGSSQENLFIKVHSNYCARANRTLLISFYTSRHFGMRVKKIARTNSFRFKNLNLHKCCSCKLRNEWNFIIVQRVNFTTVVFVSFTSRKWNGFLHSSSNVRLSALWT